MFIPTVLSGPKNSVRFVRPVTRLNSGKYTLCMIMKVSYIQKEGEMHDVHNIAFEQSDLYFW